MQKRAKAMTTLSSNACVDDCTKMDFESRATHTVKLWSCPPTHEFFLWAWAGQKHESLSQLVTQHNNVEMVYQVLI